MKNLLIDIGVENPLERPKSRLPLLGFMPNSRFYNKGFMPFKPLTEVKLRKFSIDCKSAKNQTRDQENIEPDGLQVQSVIKIRRLRVPTSRSKTSCRKRSCKSNSRASNMTQTDSQECLKK